MAARAAVSGQPPIAFCRAGRGRLPRGAFLLRVMARTTFVPGAGLGLQTVTLCRIVASRRSRNQPGCRAWLRRRFAEEAEVGNLIGRWLLASGLAAALSLAALAQPAPSQPQAAERRDGQDDFDFEI